MYARPCARPAKRIQTRSSVCACVRAACSRRRPPPPIVSCAIVRQARLSMHVRTHTRARTLAARAWGTSPQCGSGGGAARHIFGSKKHKNKERKMGGKVYNLLLCARTDVFVCVCVRFVPGVIQQTTTTTTDIAGRCCRAALADRSAPICDGAAGGNNSEKGQVHTHARARSCVRGARPGGAGEGPRRARCVRRP